MIKTESKVIDNANCGVNIETYGPVKDLYIEGAMIIKCLVIKISKKTNKDKKVILGNILKEIVVQMRD